MHRQVAGLPEGLSQQAIGVLALPALPRALRMAKINVDFGRQRKATMITVALGSSSFINSIILSWVFLIESGSRLIQHDDVGTVQAPY
jgi:hypothetical protein